jgi:hypothetical protein
VIETWGVYKSWEFRQAYVERYAKIYSLSDAEKAALYESQRASGPAVLRVPRGRCR